MNLLLFILSGLVSITSAVVAIVVVRRSKKRHPAVSEHVFSDEHCDLCGVHQLHAHATPCEAKAKACRVAEAIVTRLEDDGWLDFDAGEQHERAMIVGDLSDLILKAV
jgi:hypothetical protein